MIKEELNILVDMWAVLNKETVKEHLTKDDFALLCECFHEKVNEWRKQAENYRSQIEFLTGTVKASKELNKVLCNYFGENVEETDRQRLRR